MTLVFAANALGRELEGSRVGLDRPLALFLLPSFFELFFRCFGRTVTSSGGLPTEIVAYNFQRRMSRLEQR